MGKPSNPNGLNAVIMDPDLRGLIDRVIVPGLLERFLREHAPQQSAAEIPATPAA